MVGAIATSNVGQKDYVELGQVTAYKAFRNRVIDFEQECTKKKVPFCRKCVLDTWNDRYKMKLLMLERTVIDQKEIAEINLDSEIKFEDYVGEGHFTLKDIAEKWVVERRNDKLYYYLNFICKKFGYGNAITLTDVEYEAYKQKGNKGKST